MIPNKKEEILKLLNDSNEDQLQEIFTFAKEITRKEPLIIKDKEVPEERLPEYKKASFLQKARTFAQAYASRGLTNKKAEEKVKSLRVLSCHGSDNGELAPCPYRKNSELYPGSFYCGACGCGDKKQTQLINLKKEDGTDEYSKLDFPVVHCPLEMPGFSNYVNTDSNNQLRNPRKIFIETAFNVEYIKENSIPTNVNNGDNNEQNSNNNETQQENS
jgi:hypothetical protein